MAWTMEWYDDDHTILLFTVNQGATWEDFHLAMNHYAFELGRSAKIIHVIIYDEYGLPPGNPFPHFRAQMQKLNAYHNMGLIVSVTTTRLGFLQRIVELVAQYLHITLTTGTFVTTMDEALTRIRQEQEK